MLFQHPGTHDVYDISVTSSQPGEIRVMGDVIDGSSSKGLLVIVYSESDSAVQYNFVPHNTAHPGVYSVPVDLPDNLYRVAAFVVEENGEPFPRASATPKPVQVNGKSNY